MLGFKGLDLFGSKKRAQKAKQQQRKQELKQLREEEAKRKVEIMEVLLPALNKDIADAKQSQSDDRLEELREYRAQLMKEYADIKTL